MPDRSSEFQLVLLPGLGADRRLLNPQRESFPDLIVPPWIPPHDKESLQSYAARMAETVERTPGKPLILGGVSFGGMLACEMAHYLKPDAVVLIASCRSPRSLRPEFLLGRGLMPILPLRAWSVAKLLAKPVVQMRLSVPREQKELAVTMFRESDSRFMHWTVETLLSWQPTPLGGTAVFHIHGSRDPLIPARRVDADRFIAGGGHLINVSHAEEVNGFIREACSESQRVFAFVNDVRDYCRLIDLLAAGKPPNLYQQLHSCLSRLTQSIANLPLGRGTSAEVNESSRISHEQWRQVAARISQAISPEVLSLTEADQAYAEEIERDVTLFDSLADIYRDLRDGLDLFDGSEPWGFREALWRWKFSYEHHWGLHMFDALHTVHRIRYQLYAD